MAQHVDAARGRVLFVLQLHSFTVVTGCAPSPTWISRTRGSGTSVLTVVLTRCNRGLSIVFSRCRKCAWNHTERHVNVWGVVCVNNRQVNSQISPLSPINYGLADAIALLNAIQRPERIAMLIVAYGCVPALHVRFIVYRNSLDKCEQLVAAAKGEGQCVSPVARAPRACQSQVACTGTSQPMPPGRRTTSCTHISTCTSTFTDTKSTEAQRNCPSFQYGLWMGRRSVEPACVRATALPDCIGAPNTDNNRTCEGRTWWWWNRADLACFHAAKALRIGRCCYGWADLLWLPRHAQLSFARLAVGGRELIATRKDARGRLLDLALVDRFSRSDLREVFHEVAIPTILNALQSARWGGVRWHQARCDGSCCSAFTPALFARAAERRPLLCAHKVALQSLEKPQGRRRWWQRDAPYAGFFDATYACSAGSALEAGWYVPRSQRSMLPL